MNDDRGMMIRSEQGSLNHLSPLMNKLWPPYSKIKGRDTYDAQSGLLIESVIVPPGGEARSIGPPLSLEDTCETSPFTVGTVPIDSEAPSVGPLDIRRG